jgi:HSP20 family protein
MKKPSFFSRLTGAQDADEYEEHESESPEPATRASRREMPEPDIETGGELAVDVFQTPDLIVIKAFIAGVQPNTIDVSLTREMVTISGTREEEKEVEEDGYFQRELYWGSFSRTILLPEEVDVDLAEATEKHGVLMIRLPKINKKRQTKLKIRAR